jgi:hypothetical protein
MCINVEALYARLQIAETYMLAPLDQQKIRRPGGRELRVNRNNPVVVLDLLNF